MVDQLSSLRDIRTRKMFGEYALYYKNRVIGLICDDTLFIKITAEGKEFLGKKYKEGYAYPGAKASMKISEDQIDDREWLSELLTITDRYLPTPKIKKKK